MAVASDGSFYFAAGQNFLYKVDTAGVMTRVAGKSKVGGYAGDGGPATEAKFHGIAAVALDQNGNVYIADYGNNVIRKITTDGVVATIAGNGQYGFSGDGGPAVKARLKEPTGLAVDTEGNIYIADFYNHVVRKVMLDGTISTVAGNGSQGFSGDGGPATKAQLYGPESVKLDTAGNLYIADYSNNTVRRVGIDGTITTIAGNGQLLGDTPDGGLATETALYFPSDVAIDGAGTVYIADSGSNRVRVIKPDGTIATVAGSGALGHRVTVVLRPQLNSGIHVFVDLYTVVRQALIIGEPAYSLKNIEHLYAPARDGEVATAGASMVYYHRWLTVRDGQSWESSPTLKLIRDYNQVDCESTWNLIAWLRQRQTESGVAFVVPEPPKELAEETSGRAALAQDMLAAIPVDRSAEPERWRVHELMAHLLEFHRREKKSLYWELFERMKMTEEELIADRECLGRVERTATAPVPVNRSYIYEYRFPIQESKLRAGSKCVFASDGKTGFEIQSIDYDRQLLTVKRGRTVGPPPDRMGLLPDEIVGTKCIEESIERTVRSFRSSGALPPALSDFLYRRAPRVADHGGGPVIGSDADVAAGVVVVVTALDNSTLCIQGPPGSGKTMTGGRMIAELLRRGKRVAISSNSHDAICVLMKSVGEAADRLGLRFTGVKCGKEDREPPHPSVTVLSQNGDLFKLPQLPMLVGATAWVFSRPEAVGRFDYLFIDEAGQVSIANLVGMAPAARNIVLLGDQMQLNQPIHGVHPGESGTSVLEYYLQGHATIPDDMGIFLPTSYRMRPEICEFISNAVYDGRLKSDACTSDRSIHLRGPVQYVQRTAGIVHVPVTHSGNTYDCDEEAAVICQIVGELRGHILEQRGTAPRPITPNDILVVAPFNLQVRKLQSLLDRVRVGTVDKFQGQQAPVVIFSMTSSEGDASPRGIEFLFDKHRLNVAISRAQVMAVVVGSPALERTRCLNLEQMRAINIYCRAVETGAGRFAGA
ncbi:MAG TPA: AAA domain-containing protein [Bryobacteraceae bacterium]